MKIFLDECVDRRFALHISGHEVKTARQMGWLSIKNGELLRLAAQHFDIFLTVDRNLAFQQNLAAHPLPIVVLQAPSNRLADLTPLAPALLARLADAKPGTVLTISTADS